MYVLGVAAMIFALATARLPLDKIAHWTGVTMTADEIGRMALAAFTGAIAALVLIHFILRGLRRVVTSASSGDPFIEANAAELIRVAWLLLGVDVIAALIKPMVYLLAPAAVRAKVHDTVHISVTGLFAVLLICLILYVSYNDVVKRMGLFKAMFQSETRIEEPGQQPPATAPAPSPPTTPAPAR